jgi:acylphosphatase
MITITNFNGTNYRQWATEMALLLEQKQVYGIIKGYDDKLEEAAANATATEKAAFKDCMNRHGVARSTILLGIQPRIPTEYTVVNDVKML